MSTSPNENDNYDPFEELNDGDVRARKLDTLEKGKMYRVTKLFPQISSFKDDRTKQFPMNCHCNFDDEDLPCTTILPKKFNNKSDRWYTVMNKLIAEEKGPRLVFYGKVGLGNEADLLRHTQEINQERLKLVASIEKKEEAAALKRKGSSSNSDSSSPSPLKRTNSSKDNM